MAKKDRCMSHYFRSCRFTSSDVDLCDAAISRVRQKVCVRAFGIPKSEDLCSPRLGNMLQVWQRAAGSSKTSKADASVIFSHGHGTSWIFMVKNAGGSRGCKPDGVLFHALCKFSI